MKHMPSSWTLLRGTAIVHYVSHLASMLDSELLHGEEDHNLSLSQSQKRMAKTRFHSLTKGKKENP